MEVCTNIIIYENLSRSQVCTAQFALLTLACRVSAVFVAADPTFVDTMQKVGEVQYATIYLCTPFFDLAHGALFSALTRLGASADVSMFFL